MESHLRELCAAEPPMTWTEIAKAMGLEKQQPQKYAWERGIPKAKAERRDCKQGGSWQARPINVKRERRLMGALRYDVCPRADRANRYGRPPQPETVVLRGEAA